MQKTRVNSGFTMLARKGILEKAENLSRGLIAVYFILLIERGKKKEALTPKNSAFASNHKEGSK